MSASANSRHAPRSVQPDEPRVRTKATAFGLDIRATLELPFLARARALPAGRVLHVRAAGADVPELGWSSPARAICVRARADGSVYFRIEADPNRGYRICGERQGSYLLSATGAELCCATGASAAHTWQRFLVGQVLPFAALLAGLEIFHASAVVLDGHAVGFSGRSGAGKTSLALQLCRRGARFLADDVLALEVRGQSLIAHPGPPLAGVDRREARRLRERGQPPAQKPLGGDSREIVLPINGARAPAPLRALYLLDRRADGSGPPRFEPLLDVRELLGATFNFVLETPRRMRGLLEVCALASQGTVERIVIAPGVDAGELAEAVISRLGGAA